MSFKHTRVDALLEENRCTFDAQKRIEIYREFQQILNAWSNPTPSCFFRKPLLLWTSVSTTSLSIRGDYARLSGGYPKPCSVIRRPGKRRKEGWRHPMLTYLCATPVLVLIPTCIGVTLMAFFIIHLAPGDPAELRAGGGLGAAGAEGLSRERPSAVDQALAAWRAQYGLNQPLQVQYGRWLRNLFTLEFGDSFKDNQPVWRKIAERLPVTIQLNAVSRPHLYRGHPAGYLFGHTSLFIRGSAHHLRGVFVVLPAVVLDWHPGHRLSLRW